jgi:hypothetical protein
MLRLKIDLNAPLVAMMKRWRFRLIRTFFGLTDKYSEALYEQIFLLKHYGGWSFTEVYNLPIGLRNWFCDRMVKQFEDEKKEMEKSSKGRR